MSRPSTKILRLARQCECIHPRRPLTRCTPTTTTLPNHHQRRAAFSTSPRHASTNQTPNAQGGKGSSANAAAMEKRKQEALRTGGIPEDLGLLPNTFIMPSGARRPSWFSQFRQRLRLERVRLRTRFIDGAAIAYYRFSWHIKPKPRLNLNEIPTAAKALHQNMYEHFAAGQLEPLQTTVVPGFLGKLRARIAQRPSRMPLRWKLHEYKSAPRLMSLKVGLFPAEANATARDRRGMVQAVVRIHSLQSLHHVRRVPLNDGKKNTGAMKEVLVDARGRELSEAEYEQEARREAKESVEYVVLQKRLQKSREGPWKIWGTTEETTLEKLDREQRSSAQGPAVGAS